MTENHAMGLNPLFTRREMLGMAGLTALAGSEAGAAPQIDAHCGDEHRRAGRAGRLPGRLRRPTALHERGPRSHPGRGRLRPAVAVGR